MPNTPGNAPPSANRLDAFMQSKSPSAEIGKFNQDPQAAAVMQWLATPEAQEFLRRVVTEKGLMDRGAPGGPAGPGGPGGPGGPPGIGGIGADIAADPIGAAPPGGPGAWRPGPPRTAPGMGPSPAPGVPGGTRDLSDPASFGPQGQHPLAGIGRAIGGAFEHKNPYYDEATGRTLYPGDPGYRQRDSRGQIVQELAASQAGPRFGPGR